MKLFRKEQSPNGRRRIYFCGIKVMSYRKKTTEIRSLNEFYETLEKSINQNTRFLLKVSNLHSKVFPKYKNINKDNTVVLIGTGPSLNQYKPIEHAVYVGVNRAIEYNKVKFDYFFIQDFLYPEYLSRLNEYVGNNCKKFYGLLNDPALNKVSTIPESESIEAKAERYYCNQNRQGMPVYDLSTEPFFNSGSVALVAMQFILWTNPKRIYLVGCDTNLSGHYNGQQNNLRVNNVLNGWNLIKDFTDVYYPKTEIISVNPVGLKKMFKDEYTND
jgi:hypothetical protein